jgi:hypothetical protein
VSGAMGILARAGVSRKAAVCPHPGPRVSCAIHVEAARVGMVLCPTCLQTLQKLIELWHANAIGVKDVTAQMFALGYTRGDALRFLSQLMADRIRIRLGLLRADQL